MHVMDYLNSIYDSDDLHDYKYGKINPEPLDMPESDKDILLFEGLFYRRGGIINARDIIILWNKSYDVL